MVRVSGERELLSSKDFAGLTDRPDSEVNGLRMLIRTGVQMCGEVIYSKTVIGEIVKLVLMFGNLHSRDIQARSELARGSLARANKRGRGDSP